jgi:hypothetical protein
MIVMETKDLPINCAARNSVWVYPRPAPPRFAGAPVIFEIARSHERPDIFSLPKGSDVTVELYGGAVVLRLEGELRRVHIRRFDHMTLPTEEEARHAFMRLWRDVAMLESVAQIELAAERWLKVSC